MRKKLKFVVYASKYVPAYQVMRAYGLIDSICILVPYGEKLRPGYDPEDLIVLHYRPENDYETHLAQVVKEFKRRKRK